MSLNNKYDDKKILSWNVYVFVVMIRLERERYYAIGERYVLILIKVPREREHLAFEIHLDE